MFLLVNMEIDTPDIKALEFYSGIGGFHYALKGIDTHCGEVCAAVDINTSANETYKYNFPCAKLLQRNIESFTAEEIDHLGANLFWMSPPCQPFTRIGKQRDCDDQRTNSFLHLISLIPHLKKKPVYIMLENVKGFEDSMARAQLIKMFQEMDYNYQEFLLTPQMFGIPNSRLRYYVIAKLKPCTFSFQTLSEVMTDFPQLNSIHLNLLPESTMSTNRLPTADSETTRVRSLNYYLEKTCTDAYFEDYLLPDKVLLKYYKILDIVNNDATNSCCFTKGYSHYVEGTGSVLHSNLSVKVSDVYCAIESHANAETSEIALDLLRTLKLRYFTPREIANLMNFPKTFCFPAHFTSRQKYRLLGNSINAHVVQKLLQLCLDNCLSSQVFL